MYSMVLMMALSNGAAVPSVDASGYALAPRVGNHLPSEQLNRHGCKGCKGCGGCYGCYGGWSCGGCYGGWNCGGCYGGWSCGGGYGGCYGGHVIYSSGGYGHHAYAPSYGYSSGYFQPTDMQYAPADASDRQDRRDQGRDNRDRRDGQDRRDQRRNNPDEESAADRPATLTVRLPADARLTVDGAPTQSKEAVRTFVTPPLEAGKAFRYTLKAQVSREGKPVEVTREVTVRAGEETAITLDLPSRVAQK